MEKTAEQIEEDIYKLIKKSSIKKFIQGNIYRAGTRPINAKEEDVVVAFLTGRDGQEQNGIVLVHVYVPNIKLGGESMKNVRRVSALQSELNSFLASLTDPEYLFEKDGTPKAFPAEGVDQHFINLRLKYRRITI